MPLRSAGLFGFAVGTLVATAAIASDDKPPVLDCKLAFDQLTRAVTSRPDGQKSTKENWDMVQINSAGAGEKDWWIALYELDRKMVEAIESEHREKSRD
jgi:hypothetical protein